MKWPKQLVSSLTVSATLIVAQMNPTMASTQANLSPAIDYMICESMPLNFDFDFDSDDFSASGDNVKTFTESTESTSTDVKRIDVIAREYEFTPNVLEVRTGTKLEVSLKNDGKENHNLTFKTLPYKTETTQSGSTAKLEMTAPAPGRYVFYCSVDGHEKRGMTGVMVVSQ